MNEVESEIEHARKDEGKEESKARKIRVTLGTENGATSDMLERMLKGALEFSRSNTVLNLDIAGVVCSILLCELRLCGYAEHPLKGVGK